MVDTPASAVMIVDIDIICNIASFMNPGSGLNFCVAVGSADAARIRTEYLRDNEQYVVASLKKLGVIPNLAAQMAEIFRDNLHLFDKCRDNISAWMRVNTNWKSRCTDENMERYRSSSSSR